MRDAVRIEKRDGEHWLPFWIYTGAHKVED